LINFASRWETKSIILALKFLEIEYIKSKTNKKPILIIDDLISELDEKHIDLLIKEIKNYQSIISNILPLDKENCNIIYL
jgi:DNA replication and repair protein RecF